LIIKIERSFSEEVHGATHISEVAMDDYKCDFNVVNNSKDLDVLRYTAKDTVKFIMEVYKNG
jgi:hypothetical protein